MTKLPIYEGFVLPELTKCHNRGLLFDKFCNRWDASWNSLGTQKKEWLNIVASRVGDASLIDDSIRRLLLLVEELNGKALFMSTAGRFVTGTGNNNPVEVGFTWHPTLGVPYLPGSSVKGLVSSWAETNAREDSRLGWLKDKLGSLEIGSGEIVFFDALPCKPVDVVVDVMTPHYPDYYTGNAPPGDWQSPVPIPFLTVDTGQSFLFSFAHRCGDSVPPENMDYIEEQLEMALEFQGAGAKTAVGYGQFIVDEKESEFYLGEKEKKKEEKQKIKELQKMSPIYRELNADGYKDDDFIGKIEMWLNRAEAAEGMESKEIAEALRKWYEVNRPGYYESPNKKNVERINRIKRLLN